MRLDLGDGGGAIGREVDLEAGIDQAFGHDVQDKLLVLNEKNAQCCGLVRG